jgi:ParB-like chromosome segregation protein Spo0J
MEIIKKNIATLLPAKYNPRKNLQPGDNKYEHLKKSILEFSYIDPVIWNKRTNTVVGGHQRLKILQELGYKEIEVSVVDLPEEKEKALNLALNKIGDDGWDYEKLAEILDELQNFDFDVEVSGFDMDEIKTITKISEEELPEETVEIRPFKKTHVLLSFSPELFIKIQSHLDAIISVEGIEYEQSSN